MFHIGVKTQDASMEYKTLLSNILIIQIPLIILYCIVTYFIWNGNSLILGITADSLMTLWLINIYYINRKESKWKYIIVFPIVLNLVGIVAKILH